MAKQCEMVIGFLVPHQCDHPALGTCIKCGRGFCEEHLEVTPQGLVCLACKQGLTSPVILPSFAQDFTPDEMALFETPARFHEEDDTDMFSDMS